jgi:hypothetical protein
MSGGGAVVELGGGWSDGDCVNSTTVLLAGNRTGVTASWQLPHALTVVALASAEPATSFVLEVSEKERPNATRPTHAQWDVG